MSSIDQYRFTGKDAFDISKFDTSDCGEFQDREEAVDEFVENLRKINKYQQKLYAERKEGVVFVFQAMDAAGKDGVIRTVFSTLSPHGVKEYCFKVPSAEEASHDYLWRFWSALPARGNISIFNRSYYEDVLVGKVHRLYENQTRPDRLKRVDIIKQRYGQIRDFERYLFNTGTRVVKIFLNVSKDEQARRFISRLDTPEKNWKVSSGDISERAHWDEYMEAFETMVNTTSTKNSPWYVVPADHKWYCRLIVSRIVLQTLIEMDPQYPVIASEELEEASACRQSLADSIADYAPDSNEAGKEFSRTGDIAADMLFDEEQQKISGRKEQLKNNGFRAVREMVAKGYILKSPTDIIGAVADAENAPADGEAVCAAEEDSGADAGALLEEAYEKFGLEQSRKLSAREAELLCSVIELEDAEENPTFYTLCDYMDLRPSTLDERLTGAQFDGLADVDEDGTVTVTEYGMRCLCYNKKAAKSEKKFRKFLKCLNAEELREFIDLCDSVPEEDFVFDEEAEPFTGEESVPAEETGDGEQE